MERSLRTLGLVGVTYLYKTDLYKIDLFQMALFEVDGVEISLFGYTEKMIEINIFKTMVESFL